MSEKNKKYFQIGYHIVLILLATVFVAVTLLPMVTIDANQSEYPEVYYEGRFTQGMKPIGEIDIGYGTVLDLEQTVLDCEFEVLPEKEVEISGENTESTEETTVTTMQPAPLTAPRPQSVNAATRPTPLPTLVP